MAGVICGGEERRGETFTNGRGDAAFLSVCSEPAARICSVCSLPNRSRYLWYCRRLTPSFERYCLEHCDLPLQRHSTTSATACNGDILNRTSNGPFIFRPPSPFPSPQISVTAMGHQILPGVIYFSSRIRPRQLAAVIPLNPFWHASPECELTPERWRDDVPTWIHFCMSGDRIRAIPFPGPYTNTPHPATAPTHATCPHHLGCSSRSPHRDSVLLASSSTMSLIESPLSSPRVL